MTSAINIRRLKYTRKIEDEESNESSQCHSWSKKEIELLLVLVIENKNLLEGKHGPSVTEASKRKKLQEIVAAINACGVALRTVDTCKKKLRDIKKNARDYLNSFKVPKTGGGKEKKTLWDYDVVLDHSISSDSPFLHGVADGVRAGTNGLFGSEEPKKRNEISGDCIKTLNEKCNRQKCGEDHNQIHHVHQSLLHNDGDAENSQPAQLQKTEVCMTVDVCAASSGDTGSIYTAGSSCKFTAGSSSTNTAGSPLNSTRIATEQGAPECQKYVSNPSKARKLLLLK